MNIVLDAYSSLYLANDLHCLGVFASQLSLSQLYFSGLDIRKSHTDQPHFPAKKNVFFPKYKIVTTEA